MERILAAWKLGTIQDYLNIRNQLWRYGKTDEDVKAYVKQKAYNASHHVSPKDQFAGVSCIKCSEPMRLYKVNSGPGDQISDERMHSQWWCPSCDISIFNPETFEEIISQKASSGKMVKEHKVRG